jgi:antitoxin (DNA-binding transcriptional repressor) of toxin-antitoxin stability system
MTTVGSYQAKTHLPELLDRVAHGEKILITRCGIAVALLIPPPPSVASNVVGIISQMKALRRGNTLGDLSIRELIEEGRRF